MHNPVNRKHIVLIDDNAIFRFVFSNMIAAFPSYEITLSTYENALEALEALRLKPSSARNPDAIFIDINMPYMTGWELVEKFQMDYPALLSNCSIYITSSSTSNIDFKQLEDFPFIKNYIPKPIEKTDLFEILEDLGKHKF